MSYKFRVIMLTSLLAEVDESDENGVTDGKTHVTLKDGKLKWSSSWLSGIFRSAFIAVTKGWVKQEIVTQFKLAIPVVSFHTIVASTRLLVSVFLKSLNFHLANHQRL